MAILRQGILINNKIFFIIKRGQDNKRHVWKHDRATAWAKPEVQKKYPCFVLAPQCPRIQKWNYVDFGKGTYSMDTLAVGMELITALNLLDSVLNIYRIDKNRQYITGLSMGGYGNRGLIIRNCTTGYFSKLEAYLKNKLKKLGYIVDLKELLPVDKAG